MHPMAKIGNYLFTLGTIDNLLKSLDFFGSLVRLVFTNTIYYIQYITNERNMLVRHVLLDYYITYIPVIPSFNILLSIFYLLFIFNYSK